MAVDLVWIAGVPLPAREVAEALDGYVLRRLLEDRKRRRDQVTLAFRSAPWDEARRRLRAGAQDRPRSSTTEPWLSCAEYASIHNVTASTVRRWAQAGRISGARKQGNTWLIPIGESTCQCR